ncbi:MAG: type II secretion system protein GspE, partial [Nitrospirae bacterium]|nr:type II secretion system protein GspE [Nitrospirota bacterium]
MGVIGGTTIGQMLIQAKLITEKQLMHALQVQKKEKERLGAILLKLGYITESALVSFLGNQYNIQVISQPEIIDVDKSILNLIPYETALKYQILPISMDG